AKKFQVSARSACALISHVGVDCAGAGHVVRPEKLDRARTVLTAMGDQGTRAACGDLKFFCPSLKHELILRQQSPDKRLDHIMRVLRGSERHRQREGVGASRFAPFIIVNKFKPAALVLPHAADFTIGKQDDQLTAHLFGPLAFSMMASISTDSTSRPPRRRAGVSPSTDRVRRRASSVLRTRPISARGLPRSTSITHRRLTPTFLASSA